MFLFCIDLSSIIKAMNGKKITKEEIQRIISLRQKGFSLPEIMREVKRGSSTVFRYCKEVVVLPEYKAILVSKQGGSRKRSAEDWKRAEDIARSLFLDFDKTSKILLAAALYWAEGAKRDFSLINSDPNLVKVFAICLREIGVPKNRLKITLRIYEDISRSRAIRYWAGILQIPIGQISNVNVLKGKKIGKLKYGMCRVRVSKGGSYLKLLQSIIGLVSSRI